MRVERLVIIVMIHYYRHHHYHSSLSISDDHYHRHPYSITPINLPSSLSISMSISISTPSREKCWFNKLSLTAGRVVQPLKYRITHTPILVFPTRRAFYGKICFHLDLDSGGDGGCCEGEEDERRMRWSRSMRWWRSWKRPIWPCSLILTLLSRLALTNSQSILLNTRSITLIFICCFCISIIAES